MSDYQLTPTAGLVLRVADNAYIPIDSDVADSATYKAWLAEGNTPDPAPVISTIPQEVSAFQAKAALLNAGLLTAVEAYFADPATDPVQVLAWKNATTFERDSPTLAAGAAHLGLTSDQLDALFTAAATLQA